MHSSIVDSEDYLRYKNNDKDNNIERFFKRIKRRFIPSYLKQEAKEILFYLEKDRDAINNHYATRYIVKIHTDNEELERYFNSSGPHIIYVKQF